jgi:hypothetical protein
MYTGVGMITYMITDRGETPFFFQRKGFPPGLLSYK